MAENRTEEAALDTEYREVLAKFRSAIDPSKSWEERVESAGRMTICEVSTISVMHKNGVRESLAEREEGIREVMYALYPHVMSILKRGVDPITVVGAMVNFARNLLVQSAGRGPIEVQ